MAIEINQFDFSLIGQLAVHCDKDKLDIAIEESIIFDFEPILCNMFGLVSENWNDNSDKWKNLINGTSYTGCNDNLQRHLGLKRMLLYYIYARYVVLNSFNDSANGLVMKSNDFSIPKPLKEIEQFADKYRSMAFSTWKGVSRFICHNAKDYADLKPRQCEDCGCNGEDCSSGSVKGYGIRGKNITKWTVRN